MCVHSVCLAVRNLCREYEEDVVWLLMVVAGSKAMKKGQLEEGRNSEAKHRVDVRTLCTMTDCEQPTLGRVHFSAFSSMLFRFAAFGSSISS